MDEDNLVIDLLDAHEPPHGSAPDISRVARSGNRPITLAAALGVVVAIVWLLAVGFDDETAAPAEPEPGSLTGEDEPEVLDAASEPLQMTGELLAERFATNPTAENLRQVFNSIGGFEMLEVAQAEGDFDLVRFDPMNHDRLLASRRRSYGPAENQAINEIWEVQENGTVAQSLWAPGEPHDFAHYNVDGTITMWTHGGGSGFAPRQAVLRGADGPLLRTASIYASRFAATAGTVFALTGNGDYYTNTPGYVSLIAEGGNGRSVLDDGEKYGWIDTPQNDLLVAYPVSAQGRTAVWNAASLSLLPDHPLAGRAYQRSAMSGDGTTALGVNFRGELEVVDLATNTVVSTFGLVEIHGVDQPLTLNRDGSVAITVERTGLVTIWWVESGELIASITSSAAQPRWVSAEYAARSTSAVASGATRIALHRSARGDLSTRWLILDTDLDSWIRRACADSGPPISDQRNSPDAAFVASSCESYTPG